MLSYFDESILNGYDSCPDLQDDLDEAVGIIANTTIEPLQPLLGMITQSYRTVVTLASSCMIFLTFPRMGYLL